MMKSNVLKKFVIASIIYILYSINQNVYGISDNFKFVIETIGIPMFNVYGREINEEVYKAYNVFSYGTPEELSASVGQRWKDSKYGLWSKGTIPYSDRSSFRWQHAEGGCGPRTEPEP